MEISEKTLNKFKVMNNEDMDNYIESILKRNSIDDIDNVIELLEYAQYLEHKVYSDYKGPFIQYYRTNQLCYYLAQDHNPEYLKYILCTKWCLDLFYYIDSNLLFYFSPEKNVETCMEDSINYWTNLDNTPYLSDELFKGFKKALTYYTYGQDLVTKYWNEKSPKNKQNN